MFTQKQHGVPNTSDVPRPHNIVHQNGGTSAQALISNLWRSEHGTIQPRALSKSVDPPKPPFVIDGKTLDPVVKRCGPGKK